MRNQSSALSGWVRLLTLLFLWHCPGSLFVTVPAGGLYRQAFASMPFEKVQTIKYAMYHCVTTLYAPGDRRLPGNWGGRDRVAAGVGLAYCLGISAGMQPTVLNPEC